MFVQKQDVTVTSDGSGDATVYSTHITGALCRIIYTKTDYTNGVDFTITSAETGQAIWAESDVNATATVNPRATAHDIVGVALFYNDADDALQTDSIYLAHERVKIVIASAGAAKTGVFTIIWR